MEERRITKEQKEKLENELNTLMNNDRPNVIEQIKIARSFGDLSENAEYDAAKNQQAMIESRIGELTNILKISKVIDKKDMDKGSVSFGTCVKVKDSEGKSNKYNIGCEGSGIMISEESPIANALMGKKIGDEVEIELPKGKITLKILSIE